MFLSFISYLIPTNYNTGDNTNAAIWSIIELDMGIICASLPTIKPVISRLFPRLLSSNGSREATQPLHTNPTSGFNSSNVYSDPFGSGGIRLDDIESLPHQAIAMIEASESWLEPVARPRIMAENRKEIFVRTSVVLDIESKSETRGERDLIFQG